MLRQHSLSGIVNMRLMNTSCVTFCAVQRTHDRNDERRSVSAAGGVMNKHNGVLK